MLSTGSITDPYIPLEEKLGNVRRAPEPNVSTPRERFERLMRLHEAVQLSLFD
ncbi:MAG TPA: hypothetical protein H9744_11255 [Candidatus Eisenbergiella stercoravium]|nr:hypothetical protein [Candidatus Eisenbergiella stercoravium]